MGRKLILWVTVLLLGVSACSEPLSDTPDETPRFREAIYYDRPVPPYGPQVISVLENGEDERPVAPTAGYQRYPAVSPDRRQLAFVGEHGSNSAIFILDAGDTVPRLLTMHGSPGGLSWSPDGKMITFASETEGSSQIYTISAEGDGLARLTHSDGWKHAPAWSPDGTQIAFAASLNSNQSNIFVMNRDGSESHPLWTEVVEMNQSYGDPRWSPDGNRIVYTHVAHGSISIHVFDLETGTNHSVAIPNEAGEGFSQPAWGPNGQHIAFKRTRDLSAPSIVILSLSTGDMSTVASGYGIGSSISWPE